MRQQICISRWRWPSSRCNLLTKTIKHIIPGILLLVSHVCLGAVQEKTISIAVLSTGQQQSTIYSKWFNQFEAQYPKIRLKVDFFSDEKYKQNIELWLEEGRYDLLYWQGGERLELLVDQGLLTPVSSVIDDKHIAASIPAPVLKQVTYNDQVQGLPFAQYAWGFYYNKDVFAQLNLSPPKSWQEFVSLCETLRENGITPLIQANYEQWPLLAWLDYLSLKTGGPTLRHKLIEGDLLNQEEKHRLAQDFQWLSESNLFFAGNHAWRWQQTLPSVARKRAAMTLIGQFAESIITPEMDDKLGFFMFPEVALNQAEIAPMEVFIISGASHQKETAKHFLNYLMSPNVQLGLSVDLGMLPVKFDILPKEAISTRQRTALEALSKSRYLAQYFDREASAEASAYYANSMVASIATGNHQPFKQALSAPVKSSAPYTELEKNGAHKYLSSLQGHKGTFLASRLVRIAYNTLGYDISIVRFPSISAGLKSQEFGMDGELVRVKEFENLTDRLIRVPEPFLDVKMYLVLQDYSCAQPKLGSDASAQNLPAFLGVSSDALMLHKWAEQHNIALRQFNDEHLMWKAFRQKQIKGLITLEADLTERVNELGQACYAQVAESSLYHYVNQKNKDLVPALNEAFIQLKSSQQYWDILEQFGVGILDRSYR